MIARSWLWAAIIVASCVGVSAGALLRIDSPLRPVITLWFFLICPGIPYIRLLRLNDGVTEMTLGIALSLAIDTVVALVMLYIHLWAPQWTLLFLVYVSLAGAVLQVALRREAYQNEE